MQKLMDYWTNLSPQDTVELIQNTLEICPYFKDESAAKNMKIKDAKKMHIRIIIAGKPIVPYPDNQCDGCAQGLEVEDGLHLTVDNKPFMACSKHLYKPARELK